MNACNVPKNLKTTSLSKNSYYKYNYSDVGASFIISATHYISISYIFNLRTTAKYQVMWDISIVISMIWHWGSIHLIKEQETYGAPNGALPSLEAALLSCSMTSRIRFGIDLLTMDIFRKCSQMFPKGKPIFVTKQQFIKERFSVNGENICLGMVHYKCVTLHIII